MTTLEPQEHRITRTDSTNTKHHTLFVELLFRTNHYSNHVRYYPHTSENKRPRSSNPTEPVSSKANHRIIP